MYKNDKSSIIKVIFLFFIVFSISNLTAQTIRINEVVSSNSQHEDEDGDTPDWLELHNYGTEIVSINNWSLSDDENDLTQWVFPDIALAPDQYVLIWASSKDRSTTTGNLHTNFNISRSSETLFLVNASGTIVDQLFAENLPPDSSIGVSKNSGDLVNYLETTPGNENSDNEFIGFVESEIIFSNEGGLVNGPVTLMLSGNAAGEDIRYTVDGEMPTETSTLYSGPIQINANTSVKAQLFLANYIPSEVFTRSYIVNANHEIDVMLLTADPADLFDEETGIYVFGPNDYETVFPFKGANFWEDWERPIHFAFYEKEGNRSVEFNAGVKIFGGVSRGNAQKSLSLFARGQYGDSEFEYPFFDELSYNTFESLVLRNSGTDWLESSMKDMMTTSLMRGTDLDFQEHTPVATYINGEYWGKYNLREKINEHMLASKHNVDADDITILEINGAIIEGSNAEYFDLQRYISTTDLTDDSNFERVAEEIDLKEFALYQATEIYINNTDWLTNNIKYWKHPEGKWRWILFDTDRGFEGLTNNTLAFATADNGKEWTTLFLKKLLTNIGFRNMFINRYADELNTRFLPSIVNAHIDEIYNSIQPEINASYLRWDKDPARALVYINGIKNFANNRPPIAKEHIKSQFNLPAYHPIIITNPELSQGSVEVNSNLNIQEAFWTGDYFETVPIELKAMPKAGFEFSHWSGDIASTEQTLSLTLVGQIEVTPNFAPTNSNDPIVINEINYKSSATFDTDDWVELYNPNTTPIDISNWQLKDNNDANTFTIPGGTTIDADGYIVLVKTAADFTAVYPEITNIIGDIGFGFGGSDAVRLLDADGSLQDEVVYQSAAPWSDCADETGNTLELISADLDNALPDSWSCINTNGSPNAQNSVTQPSALVINEINYKSSASFDADDWVELYNPNTTSIDLSNWQLKDDNDLNSYVIPSGTTIDADGYIVIVKTASDFTSVYPDVTNFIGDTGFGFGGSDAVRLFDANGSLQDEVIYQSGAPWSDCADETGNTLELISADLDNALPDSWSCINTNGSPNAKNGSPVIETCPSSQIVLSTQQEVDTFSSTYDIANCTFDQGIKIAGDDITNLNGLSVLQTVNGSFDISDNTTLNDISGLSALITVNGDLQIYNNATLDNLSGLSSLSSVGGNVFISRNAALLDLSGLSAMSTVGGGLNISNNTILSNCDIVLICDETVVVDDINIYGNAGNCIDLATAEAACTFTALICPSDEVVLTTQQEVDDFSSIFDVANCTFDQGITIEGADITNLNGLSGLTEVNGSLEISNNPILTDISGLSSLSTVGGNLSISTNVSLENLNGLALLTTVGGNMLLNKNTVLTDLISLAQLTSVSGGLNISKNPVLSNCEIALVCDATAVTGDSNIYSNAGDCVDLATAEGACFGGEPVVNAGENQIIVLPITSSAIFNGTANDPDDGTIVSFEWTQTDGPDTAILSGENTATLEVTGLIAGSYIFMLTVTDDQNETGFDEVVLQVQSGGFTPPVVNAGLDQNSTETSITLNGSGSDPDGGDVVFLWTQEDGPSTANLVGSDTAELIATNLIIGEYLFKLTVTDDENETSFDEVTVTITDENPVLTCPTSQVVLTTQLEVDAFSSIYDVADCTFDQGISVVGADITNLNGLSGLQVVNGRLEISNNPILTDISGLSSLRTVGQNLTISTNVSLENLNSLALLTTVGGNMLVNKNTVLTDLIGLAQLTSVAGGINISKNPVLSNCEIALVCDATVVAGDTSIYSNTGRCLDLVTAETACLVEPPTITCPEPVTVANEAGLCESSFPIVPATATDDVSLPENITIGFVRSDGELLTLTDPFPVGETTITWTATDEAGNVSESCEQLITVIDDEAPLAVAQDIILELDENGTATLNPKDLDSVLTPSSDNCTAAVNLVYNTSRTAFSCADIGTLATVSFSVTDKAGNESLLVSAAVSVVDVTTPELTCSPNIVETSLSGQPLTLEIVPPTVTDNCDSTPTLSGLATFPDQSTLVLDDQVGQYDFPAGTTVIVWTAQDANNQGTCTQTIMVNFTPDVGSSITSFSVAGVSGTISGKNITAQVPIGTNLETLVPEFNISEFAQVSPAIGSPVDFSQGAVDYTVTAQDNSSQTIYTVLVELEPDVVAPLISLVGDNPQTIEFGDGYTELGATADDGSPVAIDFSEFMDAVGTYMIYYDATDGINAATQVTRTVNVVNTNVLVDIELSIVAENLTPNVGEEIFFSIKVKNQGPSDASGVLVENDLPSGYSLFGFSNSQGSYDFNNRIWTVGDLAAGQEADLILSLKINASGDYLISAEVTAQIEDDVDSIPNNGVSAGEDDDDSTLVSPITGEPIATSFGLIEATYLKGTSNPNPLGPILRVEEGNRETYLKFDLGSLSGPISQAQLQMQVASDPGSGTIEVFLGSNSGWTETGLNGGNKPTAVGGPLASISGAHGIDQIKLWNLDVDQLGGGDFLTLIVKHSNGNDVAFASDETNNGAVLIITSESSGPVDLDEDGSFSDVDCDDNDPSVYPGAPETCDGKDNNCDGDVDEGLTTSSFYIDSDGDGFGNPLRETQLCAIQPGYVTDNTDCNDNDASINPEAEEVCDGIDNNCDGLVDDEDLSLTCNIVSTFANLIDATYLKGASNPSPTGPILRAEEGNREIYIKFNLSTFTGPITQATLEMQVASDPGNGTLEVFLGSNSNWTEIGLNGGNKPVAVGSALATILGTYSLGQTKTWNLDVSQLTSGGEITLIVKHSNGNDVAFASDETNQAPQLLVTAGNLPEVQKPFVTTWRTDNEGVSGDNQITIPTFPGETYDYAVEWGDGTSDTGVTGDIIHSYTTSGTYEVSISGVFPRIDFTADAHKIIEINQWGSTKWSSMQSAFAGCINLDVIAIDTPDLSNVTSAQFMFDSCFSLVGNPSFNEWDTSTLTDMSYMFTGTSMFNQPIGKWDTSNVSNMEEVFSFSLFNRDIGNWNTSRVTTMREMFEFSFFNQNISFWEVSMVRDMHEMFQGSSFNQDISQWNVSNVEDMFAMFSGATDFNQDLSLWSISTVNNLGGIFSGSGLSDENYDNILNAWSTLEELQDGVEFGTDTNQYCRGEAARQKLIDRFGWIITDAGKSSDCALVEEGLADLIDATYLQGSSNPEPTGPILRAEEGNREVYLKFDTASFSGAITTAQLRMQVANDPGSGTLEVYLGSNSNWTENGLLGSNKPAIVGNQLASISGTHSLGQTKSWNLDVSNLPSGGFITLILKHSNGNDVAFASDETAQAPQLLITSAGANGAEANLSSKRINNLSLYPNPSSSTVDITFKDIKEPTLVNDIYVYDAVGRLIEIVPANGLGLDDIPQIDVRSYQSGIYFVKTLDKNGISHQKQLSVKH